MYLHLKCFMIYTNFLQCYSIFECERCDCVFVGNLFEFGRNYIVSVALNLHRQALLNWFIDCDSLLFTYWICLYFHLPCFYWTICCWVYWNIRCWFDWNWLLFINLGWFLHFLWIIFFSAWTFHVVLLHQRLVAFVFECG